MLVDELIAECRSSWRKMQGSVVTVEGHLTVTDLFAYIGTAEDSRESVLIPGGLVCFALSHHEAPALGGSMVAFEGHATISGAVSTSTGLAAFPVSLYDLSDLCFEPKHGSPITIDLRRPTGQRQEVDLFDETPNQKCAVVRMQGRVAPSLVLDAGLVNEVAYHADRLGRRLSDENRWCGDTRSLCGYVRLFRDYLNKAAAEHGLPLPRTESREPGE